MTNKTEALNIPEWKIDMSRNFIKRTIFADGFDDEFFQRLKEINSPMLHQKRKSLRSRLRRKSSH